MFNYNPITFINMQIQVIWSLRVTWALFIWTLMKSPNCCHKKWPGTFCVVVHLRAALIHFREALTTLFNLLHVGFKQLLIYVYYSTYCQKSLPRQEISWYSTVLVGSLCLVISALGREREGENSMLGWYLESILMSELLTYLIWGKSPTGTMPEGHRFLIPQLL